MTGRDDEEKPTPARREQGFDPVWRAPRPTTSKGIDNAEIIDTVHARPAPTIPVSASLRP
jgi:hypothetical protein